MTEVIDREAIKQDNNRALNANILVRDDDGFPVEIVLVAFLKVLPGYTPEMAIAKVREIERLGSSIVFSGAREVCEMYAEQLNAIGLDAEVL